MAARIELNQKGVRKLSVVLAQQTKFILIFFCASEMKLMMSFLMLRIIVCCSVCSLKHTKDVQ